MDTAPLELDEVQRIEHLLILLKAPISTPLCQEA
jgi:hypothetical protein